MTDDIGGFHVVRLAAGDMIPAAELARLEELIDVFPELPLIDVFRELPLAYLDLLSKP